MKSVETNLVETLERLANLVTPDENNYVPICDGSYVEYADLGYRIGRALSLARRLARQ